MGGLIAAGLLFQVLPVLIRGTVGWPSHPSRTLLMFIVATGLIARIALLPSEPALEDDYQRYLWDGAVIAHGMNPYRYAPREAIREIGRGSALGALAERSGKVVHRINHPDLRTLYPPVAQAFFAFAHWLAPWKLSAWRLLALTLDLAALALIIRILVDAGRSPLWCALYWWNPIVLKELHNSAHMESILAPLLLGAVLLAIRKRFAGSAFLCALAAGTKIWPMLLLPLLLRPLWSKPRALILPLSIFLVTSIALVIPILLTGIDQSSGFVAYAQQWQTNSAIMPALEALFRSLPFGAGLDEQWAGLSARFCLAVALLAAVIIISRKDVQDPGDLAIRAGFVAAATFLLSPAQFPWYFVWVAPFLPILPLPGLAVLTATLPLYYTSFHFYSFGAIETFKTTIVWLVWCPAWLLLALGAFSSCLRQREENRAPGKFAGNRR